MPLQEEDWGQDINFEGQFFQKISVEPDKELILACERYLDNSAYQTYSDDDDTNSSIYSFATGSFISSRYSTLDPELSHIDEYILNAPPSTTTMRGTVKRLGVHYKEKSDDWNDDIEIPSTGIVPIKKVYNNTTSMLDEFDDEDVGPSISQRGSPQTNFLCYEREQDDQVDDMKGLDFPDNLSLLHLKLNEKKKVTYESKATSHSKIPIPIKSSVIPSYIQRETEEDDFLDGLDIKDKFMQKPKKTLTSRLAAARPTLKEPKPTPSLARPRRNFLSSTQSSLNREAETRQQHQRWIKNKPTNGCTLITKPKTKSSTNYCTRLDNIDNLNDLSSKKKINVTFKGKNAERPWRQNMQTSKKLTLIHPNEHNIKKEYNDMKYDEKTHQWKGNESSLAGFQPKRTSRLMLMSHKQHKPSKYTAMMSNQMIFKPEIQKWVSSVGIECNELDAIEDLKELPKRLKKEYNLSREVKRQMLLEQQDHQDYMRHWPIEINEPQLIASRHKVDASKYFIKNRLF